MVTKTWMTWASRLWFILDSNNANAIITTLPARAEILLCRSTFMCADQKNRLLLEASKILKRIRIIQSIGRGRSGRSYINAYDIIMHLLDTSECGYIDLLERWIVEAGAWIEAVEYKVNEDLGRSLR